MKDRKKGSAAEQGRSFQRVEVSHRIANIGQAEVTPNVKHDGRKATGRKRQLKRFSLVRILHKQGDRFLLLEATIL